MYKPNCDLEIIITEILSLFFFPQKIILVLLTLSPPRLAYYEIRYQFYNRDQLMWSVVRHYSEQVTSCCINSSSFGRYFII